jgi:hypothetical protein
MIDAGVIGCAVECALALDRDLSAQGQDAAAALAAHD